MKYVDFVFYSSFEGMAIILLGLSLFRLNFSSINIIKSYVIGLILAILSLIFTLLDLSGVSSLIQMIVMYILVMFLFHLKYKFSFLVTLVPFIIYTLIQGAFILLLELNKIVTDADLQPFTHKGQLIQLFTCVITAVVIFVIKRTNEGYIFDPDTNVKKKLKYANRLILNMVVVGFVILSIIIGLFRATKDQNVLLNVFIATSVVITFSLMYILIQRDKEELN